MTRALILLFLVLASVVGAQPVPEHVVLVPIDGLPSYQLEDDSLEIPNLRALIREGIWAESSGTVFPSVTHPAPHDAVTGVVPRVHGVIGNRRVNRITGERFHITNRKRSESVRVPTIFDAAKAKSLVTASFCWPENRDDPAVDFLVPEVFVGDTADPRAADPAFLEELRRAGVPIDLYYAWYEDVTRNGVRAGHVRNLDVAPTIADLLGLELPTATGEALVEALVDFRRPIEARR